MRWLKLCISIVIVLIIGLHVLPLLQRLQGERQTLWPIMAWGMYKHSFNAKWLPIRTIVERTIGITSRGEEVSIGPWQTGLSHFAFYRMYLTPMRQGDASAARRLAEQLNRERTEAIIAFRLETKTYTLSDSGIVREETPAVVYQVTD